jgi:hypothetical protein
VGDVDVVVGEGSGRRGDEGDPVEASEALSSLDPCVHESYDLDSWGGGEDLEVGAADGSTAH